MNELSSILDTVETGLWELDTGRSFCALSVTKGVCEPIPLHCGVICYQQQELGHLGS